MDIEQVLNKKFSKWMDGTGPHNDIVISSRVRLARNIKELKFPHRLSEQKAKMVLEKVKQALLQDDKWSEQLQFINLEGIEALDQQILMEKHLVSPHFVKQNIPKAFIVNQDDSISIMVNEEDHLRIQCLYPGLQLEQAWQVANQIDDYLEETLNYAFSEEQGYLTACPTNVGTGLRGSVMLHLPGLVLTGQASQILAALSQFGFTVRGIYGEGTDSKGNLFQVSNQITLGVDESEIINNLLGVTRQLIEQEELARKNLIAQGGKKLEDRVYRALGILNYARVMSSNETINLLSSVRLGVDLGLIDGISRKTLTELMVLTSAGCLQKIAGKQLNPEERDVRRADIIRKKISK